MSRPARQMTVCELTSRPVGRLQGELAAEELEKIIPLEGVRLDLDSVPHLTGSAGDPPGRIGRLNPGRDLMTPSFLDGMVGYLARRNLLDRVTFSTANPCARREMALTAGRMEMTVMIEAP